MAETFTFGGQRVRFQDVDHAGIAYFANIYTYCHVAYEEFVEHELGYPPFEFFDIGELGAPLVGSEASHSHPLRHGDGVRVDVQVTHIGRSSLKMHYRVSNQDGTLCALVSTTHVFVKTPEFKSIPIPEDIRTQLERFLVPQD